jgi:hypothetical protein
LQGSQGDVVLSGQVVQVQLLTAIQTGEEHTEALSNLVVFVHTATQGLKPCRGLSRRAATGPDV